MNDARNKLRTMGGIMSSSPELMQVAAQRFNNGGIAMTTAPMAPVRPAVQYNDIMRPQMEPPVVGLGRVAPVRPAGLPESPVFRSGRNEEDDIIAELMAQSSANQPVDNIDDLRAARGFGRSAYLSGLKGNVVDIPEDTTPFDTSRKNKAEVLAEVEQELAEENAKRPTPDTFASTAQQRRIENLENIKRRLEGQQTKPTEEDLMAQEVAPSMTLEQMTEEGRKALEGLVPPKSEDPAEAEKIAQDAMSVLLKTRQPTGDGGTGDGGTDAGAGDQKPNFKQRQSLRAAFKENLDVIKDLYGIDDEDRARDRMMNLAMMGLAIASGTSPNALTNIAQGLAVGAQGFAASAAQRREREQGMREAALDLTLSERAAEDEFIRSQMEADQEFIRDLALAKAKKGDPKLYSDTASAIKTPLGEFEVFKATRQGFEEGLRDKFKAPEEVVAAYEREMSEKNRITGNLARAQQLLKDNPKQIAGIGGAFARVVTSLGNAFGIETPNLSPSQEYDTLMTQLATELAPVILGESGRTISDGDRARVAEALGFVVDKTTIGGDPGISVTGFTQTAVSDPEKLSFALESISKRLGEAYGPATDFMKKYFPDKLKQEPAGETVEVDGSTYMIREKT